MKRKLIICILLVVSIILILFTYIGSSQYSVIKEIEKNGGVVDYGSNSNTLDRVVQASTSKNIYVSLNSISSTIELNNAKGIREIHLGENISDKSISFLAKSDSIISLGISSVLLTDQGIIALLSKFKNLSHLSLELKKYSNEIFKVLKENISLKKLDITMGSVSLEELMQIVSLNEETEVNLFCNYFSEKLNKDKPFLIKSLRIHYKECSNIDIIKSSIGKLPVVFFKARR